MAKINPQCFPKVQHAAAAFWLSFPFIDPTLAFGETWNHLPTVEVPYTWQNGDTLSEVLLRHDLGKTSGPLQIYGTHGWLQPNLARNKNIEDWTHIAKGTTIYLVLPARVATAPVEATGTPEQSLEGAGAGDEQTRDDDDDDHASKSEAIAAAAKPAKSVGRNGWTLAERWTYFFWSSSAIIGLGGLLLLWLHLKTRLLVRRAEQEARLGAGSPGGPPGAERSASETPQPALGNAQTPPAPKRIKAG